MIEKQCQFAGEDSGGIYVHLLHPGYDDSIELIKEAQASPKILERVKHFLKGAYRPTGKVPVLVSALGAGEFWGSNSNGDYFPESSLIHTPQGWPELSHKMQQMVGMKWEWGYPTFYNAHAFAHHQNKNPDRAFGEVVYAVWDPDMKRVLLVIELDRAKVREMGADSVLDKIENGEFPSVSMGCRVPFDLCSVCTDWARITGNPRKDLAEHKRRAIRGLSVTTNDYCQHLKFEIGVIYPDGTMVWMWNLHPRFFDISFVFIGADKTSFVLAKLAAGFCPIKDGATICPQGCRDCHGVVKAAAAGLTPEESMAAAQLGGAAQGGAVGTALGLPLGVAAGKRIGGGTRGVLAGTGVTAAGATLGTLLGREGGRQWENKHFLRAPLIGGPLAPFGAEMEKERARKAKREKKKEAEAAAHQELGKEKVAMTLIELGATPVVGAATGALGGALGGAVHGPKGERLQAAGEGAARGAWQGAAASNLAYAPIGPMRVIPRSAILGSSIGYTAGYGKGRARKQKAEKDIESQKQTKKAQAFPEWESDPIEEKNVGAYFDRKRKQASDLEMLKEAFAIKAGPRKLAEMDLAKQAEIIKRIQSHFNRSMPDIEAKEPDIPRDILDEMGRCPGSLGTAAGMGLVLKPHEFQRVHLSRMGSPDLADSLDSHGMCFQPGAAPDPMFRLSHEIIPRIVEALRPLMETRSALGPPLKRRVMRITIVGRPRPEMPCPDHPVMDKLASAYQAYRQQVIYSVTDAVPRLLHEHPQILGDITGDLFSNGGPGLVKTGGDVVQSMIGMFPSMYLNRVYMPGPVSGYVEDHVSYSGLRAAGALAASGGVA